MRTKVLLLCGGVAVALVAAVFVGAAAATTGAPVFYDARYPAPVGSDPEGYEIAAGDDPQSDPSQGAVDEPAAGGSPVTQPDLAPPASSPPPSPPVDARPGAPTAEPIPAPDGRPTPAPAPHPPLTGQPAAPGGPPQSVNPGGQRPTQAEKQAWLAFQQIVRDCMADAGQEYLDWEWWNPAPDTSNRFPAMPADLTPEEYAAWEFALDGDGPTGDDYRWQDAGCWGYAVHVTGGTG